MIDSRTHIIRAAYIDRMIRAKKYPNCQQVAKEYNVTRKTVQRDIEMMRELGAPIEYDKQEHGYYYSQPNYAFPSISLTASEVEAILLIKQILKPYQNVPYYREIDNFFDKIMQFLPIETINEENSAIFSFVNPPASPVEKQQFEILQKATAQGKQVKIRYYSPHNNKESERIVEPFRIHHHHGAWYLIGFCHLRNEMRTFAIHRILAIELLNKDISIPSSFSVEKYLENSFGIYLDPKIYHVKLKFSAYEARWIRERQWHKSQQLTNMADGALMLEMDVKGLEDVKRWVLQY
ncbi:WYL domain-containing protein, partial [candidate division KSB1 bacterium]|nr:WYL domain-containing protein [candidate division KSB1 bacterium]